MASSPQPGDKRKVEDISSDAPLDNIVNIDPDGGDLVLVVGADLAERTKSIPTFCNVQKAVAFRVDHKALTRNSTVFKTMFGTKSDVCKPGTSEVGWTEHLPCASPVGLKFLLLVAHFGGHRKVTEIQSFQDVYEIVGMARKYRMLSLLNGKAKSWFSDSLSPVPVSLFASVPISLSVPESSKARVLYQTLQIAYTVGNKALATKVIEHLVSRSYIKNGHLTLLNGEDLEDPEFDHAGFQANIKSWKYMRIRTLEAMRRVLNHFVLQLSGTKTFDPSEKCPNHHSQHVEEEICESIALGTLQRALAKRSEWPLPEPEFQDSWSIVIIADQWRALNIRGFSDSIQKRPRKYECDWTSGLRQRIKMAAEVKVSFRQETEDDMKERAALVGL